MIFFLKTLKKIVFIFINKINRRNYYKIFKKQKD